MCERPGFCPHALAGGGERYGARRRALPAGADRADRRPRSGTCEQCAAVPGQRRPSPSRLHVGGTALAVVAAYRDGMTDPTRASDQDDESGVMFSFNAAGAPEPAR